ncbi:MAG: hypothetical protein WA137_08950 [Methanothrix sp.]|jgi:hypothetical protein
MITLSKAEGVPSSQFWLHDAFPMPGDLRPNPDWAKLPLFDRKGWRTLPFAEFAESVNERVEPSEAA